MEKGLKRLHECKDKEERVKVAKEIFEEKKSHDAVDASKEYICCFDCVCYGYPKGFNVRSSLVMQRYKLKQHYAKYHPESTKQEWNFYDSEKSGKQQKLSFDQFGAVSSKDDEIIEEEPNNPYLSEDEAHSENSECDEAIEYSEPTIDTDKAKDKTGLNLNVIDWLSKIYLLITSVFDILKECHTLLKRFANKNIKENKTECDYGDHAFIKEGVLVFDDAIVSSYVTYKTIHDIFSKCPFLYFDDNETTVLCDLCQGASIAYHSNTDHRFGKRFSNTKKNIIKHLTSKGHKDKLLADYNAKKQETEALSRDQRAGEKVFRTVYGGIQQGFSFVQIIRELSVLHFHGVNVGNINHSKGTIAKIKDCIGQVLRNKVATKLSEPLKCTGKPRPISELFDKMTHIHLTGQMQMAIAPLLNDKELLTPVYLDNYIVNPSKNKYKDMIDMVREVGDSYYDQSQVENGAADGAYAKSEETCTYYSTSVGMKDCTWVNLQWDFAHSIDLAEGNSREGDVPQVEKHLDLAQNITKQFRYGKEFSHVFVSESIDRCVSIQNEDDTDSLSSLESPTKASLMPVIRSDLKFAAHGHKFLKNYISNLSHYVRRMNDIIYSSDEPKDKQQKVKGLLSEINITHITIIYGLFDIYDCLAKAQHGVSKVNQFPWEFNDRVQQLKLNLKAITNSSYDGLFFKNKESLEKAEFPDGVSIITETKRNSRSKEAEGIETQIIKGQEIVIKFAKSLACNLELRINTGEVTTLTKSAFHFWNEEAIERIIFLTESSGRKYGNKTDLLDQFKVLKQRFSILNKNESEMKKWLEMFRNEVYYTGIKDILHLALCCFVKAPLEATAETAGSLINQHGRKSRCSLLPASLSNEIQIAWNGPAEMDPTTTSLLKESMANYFDKKRLV